MAGVGASGVGIGAQFAPLSMEPLVKHAILLLGVHILNSPTMLPDRSCRTEATLRESRHQPFGLACLAVVGCRVDEQIVLVG